MPTRSQIINIAIFIALIALGAGSRLVEALPNFAAVSAVALCAGLIFKNRLAAAAAPLGAMLISDFFIGFYADWVVLGTVYAAMIAPVFFGRRLGSRPGALRVGAFALSASIVFFVTTNLAVFISGWYGYSFAAFARTYILALPFLKYTLAGDLFFAAALFGVREAFLAARGVREPSRTMPALA